MAASAVATTAAAAATAMATTSTMLASAAAAVPRTAAVPPTVAPVALATSAQVTVEIVGLVPGALTTTTLAVAAATVGVVTAVAIATVTLAVVVGSWDHVVARVPPAERFRRHCPVPHGCLLATWHRRCARRRGSGCRAKHRLWMMGPSQPWSRRLGLRPPLATLRCARSLRLLPCATRLVQRRRGSPPPLHASRLYAPLPSTLTHGTRSWCTARADGRASPQALLAAVTEVLGVVERLDLVNGSSWRHVYH